MELIFKIESQATDILTLSYNDGKKVDTPKYIRVRSEDFSFERTRDAEFKSEMKALRKLILLSKEEELNYFLKFVNGQAFSVLFEELKQTEKEYGRPKILENTKEECDDSPVGICEKKIRFLVNFHTFLVKEILFFGESLCDQKEAEQIYLLARRKHILERFKKQLKAEEAYLEVAKALFLYGKCKIDKCIFVKVSEEVDLPCCGDPMLKTHMFATENIMEKTKKLKEIKEIKELTKEKNEQDENQTKEYLKNEKRHNKNQKVYKKVKKSYEEGLILYNERRELVIKQNERGFLFLPNYTEQRERLRRMVASTEELKKKIKEGLFFPIKCHFLKLDLVEYILIKFVQQMEMYFSQQMEIYFAQQMEMCIQSKSYSVFSFLSEKKNQEYSFKKDFQKFVLNVIFSFVPSLYLNTPENFYSQLVSRNEIFLDKNKIRVTFVTETTHINLSKYNTSSLHYLPHVSQVFVFYAEDFQIKVASCVGSFSQYGKCVVSTFPTGNQQGLFQYLENKYKSEKVKEKETILDCYNWLKDKTGEGVLKNLEKVTGFQIERLKKMVAENETYRSEIKKAEAEEQELDKALINEEKKDPELEKALYKKQKEIRTLYKKKEKALQESIQKNKEFVHL